MTRHPIPKAIPSRSRAHIADTPPEQTDLERLLNRADALCRDSETLQDHMRTLSNQIKDTILQSGAICGTKTPNRDRSEPANNDL
jgi:hypothetical protein